MFQDGGTSSTRLWQQQPAIASWSTRPVVVPGPTATNIYVGLSDGRIQQVSADTGAGGGIQAVTPSPQSPNDPTYTDIDGMPSVIIPGTDRIVRFRTPWCTTSGGA